MATIDFTRQSGIKSPMLGIEGKNPVILKSGVIAKACLCLTYKLFVVYVQFFAIPKNH
jgi:hypothetical protein